MIAILIRTCSTMGASDHSGADWRRQGGQLYHPHLAAVPGQRHRHRSQGRELRGNPPPARGVGQRNPFARPVGDVP